jgi:hypothetical protein
MIRDEKLELSALWGVRTGPDIGPWPSGSTFTITPPSSTNGYMTCAIKGGAYADAMAALQRPYLPNMGRVSLEYDILTDANAPAQAQAIETDIRICDPNGYNYNGSFQINYQQGGEIQVYTAPVPWANTGLMPGKHPPMVTRRCRIAYAFDVVKHTISTLTAVIDGVTYAIPVTLQNVPGQLLNWVPGIYVQLQSDLAANGGSFSLGYRNIAVVWE